MQLGNNWEDDDPPIECNSMRTSFRAKYLQTKNIFRTRAPILILIPIIR